jgi:hypothetical protein
MYLNTKFIPKMITVVVCDIFAIANKRNSLSNYDSMTICEIFQHANLWDQLHAIVILRLNFRKQDINKLRPKLVYDSVRTSNRTQPVTITNINWLTLFNPLKPKLV